MRLVKIGVAAISVKVGDFPENCRRLTAAIEEAQRQGVHLLVTPELGISGYSLEDRIYWPDITRHSWYRLQELAKACADITVFVGLPVRIEAMVYNATACIHDGRVRGLILKKHLPTYSVFYEGRNWTAWPGGVTEHHGLPAGDLVFRLPYGLATAEICEDLWTSASPARDRVLAGAEIICNPSASPFTPRKNLERKRLVQGTASNLKAAYAYANLLGCDNSRLVFDGGGLIAQVDRLVTDAPILGKENWTLATGILDLDEITRMRGENTTFRQGLERRGTGAETRVIDATDGRYTPASIREYAAQMPRSFYMEDPVPRGPQRTAYLDELFDALVLGLRDYFEKVGVFDRFLIALSGGRDSALCLLMAVEAAKWLKEGTERERYAERVWTAYLPNHRYSSSGTEEAARALAKDLGVPFQVVDIDEESQIALQKQEELLGDPERVVPVAKQNLQARIRGSMMLNWGNSAGGLVLVTSNLSEAAVGYSTTGGDNQGGYSPIANVPKTLVTELLAYIAERDNIRSLKDVLAIPPSAELAEDQQDEKDLMPYLVLDDLLFLYGERRLSLADCWKILCARRPEHTPEQLRAWTGGFATRFAYNQWKRDQHPVALKVMELDLDPKSGFRFPVTQSIRYELDDLAAATLDEE